MPLLQIPVAHLLPNPYRDFVADPPDDAHVQQLVESMTDKGDFWGGLVGRPSPTTDGAVELAFGEHRRRAAIKAGKGTIPVMVFQITDPEMVHYVFSENATQRSGKAHNTALLGSVAAVVKLLLRAIITGDVAPRFLGKAKLKQLQVQLQRRHCLGRGIVERYMHGWPGVNMNQVRAALQQLKDSGRYIAIAKQVEAELRAEAAKADNNAAHADASRRRRKQQAAHDAAWVRKAAEAHTGRPAAKRLGHRAPDVDGAAYRKACSRLMGAAQELKVAGDTVMVFVMGKHRLDKDVQRAVTTAAKGLAALQRADKATA